MERTVFLTDLLKCGQVEVVAEARGKNEDAQLHDQYQIIGCLPDGNKNSLPREGKFGFQGY